MKLKMLLEVFFLIIFVINLSKEENSEFINMSQFDSEYRKIVFDAFSLIMNISNQEVLNAEKDKNYPCLNKLSISLMNGNISTLINLSGQGLMKLGNEKECQSEGYEYYLFNLEIQPEIFDIKGHQDLSEFIGINNYKLGVCIFKECDNLIQFLVNKTSNTPFHEYLMKHKNISNIYIIDEIDKTTKFTTKFIVSAIGVIMIILARLILCCVSSVCTDDDNIEISEEDSTNKKKKDDALLMQNKESEQEDSKKEEEDEKKSKSNSSEISSNSLFNQYTKNYKKPADIQALDNLLQKQFPRSISISESVTSRSSTIIVNQYICFYISDYFMNKISHKHIFYNSGVYNDTGIEIFSGLRTGILFLIVVHRVVLTFYEFPSVSYGTLMFYNSIIISFIKVSSFALPCWIFIDGFLFSYKLMFWLKKRRPTFYTFFQFFITSFVPKCIVFFVVFLLYVNNMKDISIMFGKKKLFSEFINKYGNCDYLKSHFLLFYPFYFSYYYYFFLGKTETCFSFISFVVNETYCLIGFLILFYLLFKISSSKFDRLLFLLFIVNICASYFSYNSIEFDNKKYTINYWLNEKLTLLFPHLMFNIFFSGSLFGLIYFYYNETISQYQIFIKKDFYLPFKFLLRIISFLSTLKKYQRYFIFYLSCFILLNISLLYPYLKHALLKERLFLFSFNTLFRFIYVYEKIVFVFFFGIMSLMILISSDKFWVKIILRSRLFISISRMSFAFLLIIEVYVYMFFTLFDLSGFLWNYQNIWYVSIFLSIVITAIAELITIYFEIPFRIIVKRMKENSNIISNKDRLLLEKN